MKRGNPALLRLPAAPGRRAVRPAPAGCWPEDAKNACAKENPPGAGGESVNEPVELSYGAGS